MFTTTGPRWNIVTSTPPSCRLRAMSWALVATPMMMADVIAWSETRVNRDECITLPANVSSPGSWESWGLPPMPPVASTTWRGCSSRSVPSARRRATVQRPRASS